MKSSTRPTLANLQRELGQAADPKRARDLARFFKTGKGQYGEGDEFSGITVPVMRKLAKSYTHLNLADVKRLLNSRVHEHRYTALLILVSKYETGNASTREKIFEFYLQQTRCVNNWDLVDTSAPYIVGEHLLSRSRSVLYDLARSSSLWERRIAMVATMTLIRNNDLEDAFAIAKLLLGDEHDLIHKAVGWMLREAGKRSTSALLSFLERNYPAIPRTSLRYAIERLPAPQRKRILNGLFEGRATRAAAR